MLLKIAIEIVEMLLAQYKEEFIEMENGLEASHDDKMYTHISLVRTEFALKELKRALNARNQLVKS